jgi:hypothetical protein
MHRTFPKGLYSILFFILLFISGCNIAGGGFVEYSPPKKIICNTPWTIIMKFSVVPVDPKEKYGKLAGRYKDVTIHIRDSVNSDFVVVTMIVESVDPATGEIKYIAYMKPISYNTDIRYVEYYMDYMFDHSYNRTELYRVPVSKY